MKGLLFVKKTLILFCCFSLCLTLAFGFYGCGSVLPSAQAADLMKGITPEIVEKKDADTRFVRHMAEISAEIFKRSAADSENTLVSPLSVVLALAMTANGASGETLEQMSRLIGGGIPQDELNQYLLGYVKGLPSASKSKLEIANSIWFRDDENRLTVEKDFLQTNANFYNAGAFKAPFDKSTIKQINSWVDDKTDGMIDKIIESIADDAVMYLINAIVFDARWENVYKKTDISDGIFKASDGREQNVKMMYSTESIYLYDGSAVGFVKNYDGGNYSFAALLPNEDVGIDNYISSLSGARLLSVIDEAKNAEVAAAMPKFSFDYTLVMNNLLEEMGMTDAFSFSDADFSKMATSSQGNIYVGKVLHKTFISVDELGTKAGAVTKVEMKDACAALDVKTVILDRPFVFAIIDNSSGLPLFMGAALSMS